MVRREKFEITIRPATLGNRDVTVNVVVESNAGGGLTDEDVKRATEQATTAYHEAQK